MNFNQIKYIVEIADELNITKASKKLFVSQSSLSQCIKSLEKELKVKLFQTNVTPLKLTYSGEVFLAWAKNVLSLQNAMLEKINKISFHDDFKITVGVATHRSIYLLPQVIKEFQEKYPNSLIIIKEYPTPILHKMLEKAELDILLDENIIDSIFYNCELLMQEEIYLDLPENFKNDEDEIDLADLKDVPFILLSQEQKLGKLARELCQKSSFEPKIVAECRNIETAHSLVKQNLGVALVPQLFAKYSKDCTYKKIKNFRPMRNICAIYNHKSRIHLKDFISVIKKNINI